MVTELLFDLELLTVRLVDAGDVANNRGPLYRVWFRNNTDRFIDREFHVAAFVADEKQTVANPPRAMERIGGMKPAEMRAVDLRLPVEANRLAESSPSIKYPSLYVAVDANLELAERNEENNTAALSRAEVPLINSAIAQD
jgi:hypothetical protein